MTKEEYTSNLRRAMVEAGLAYWQRRNAAIWAARHNVCPSCSAPAYSPCLNLTKLQRGSRVPTRWPHDDRVDWAKLEGALKQRGFLK